MKARLFLALVVCLTLTVPALMAQVSGRTTLTVGTSARGTSSLLSGMTPSNMTVPSGWTLTRKQDFEGSLGPAESIIGTVTTANSHTGQKSIVSPVAGDSATTQWVLAGRTGTSSEVYLSYWEFLDGNAACNDEFTIANISKNDGVGALQEITIDRYGYSFNSTTPSTAIILQPGYKYTGVDDGSHIGPSVGMSAGWHQWEIDVHPSTAGHLDGFVYVYHDGVVVYSISTVNLDNSVDMSNLDVLAGGVYSKAIWKNGDGSCSAALGTGTDVGPCADFHNCPCAPTPPIFNRYIDDIIVLQK